MNGKNFDSFKNLKAPQEWIDNAINIQNSDKKTTPVFFVKYSRFIAAAACLVLVCVVSIFMYSSHNKTNIPVDSISNNQTDKTDITDNKNNTDNKINHNTENEDNDKNNNHKDNNNGVTDQDGSKNKPQGTHSNTKPTDVIVGPTQPTDSTNPPTETPTKTPGDTTVTPTNPTVNPPTQKPTSPNEKPKPTIPPTNPDDDKPSQPPSTPSKPSNPGGPGAPGTSGPPSEGNGPSHNSYVTFSIAVDAGLFDDNRYVYCNVVDQSGNSVTPQTMTLAQVVGNTAYISCEVYSYNFSGPGYYTCHFTNSYYYYLGNDTKYIS